MVIYPQGLQLLPASVLGGGSGDDAEAPPNSESSQKRSFMVTAPFREAEAHGQRLTTGQEMPPFGQCVPSADGGQEKPALPREALVSD